ncbi:hypothetical protein JRT4AKPX_JRT4AKP_00023 [Klebsiella pneumoniae]|nr:hypothetical protein JRT4AKPX_JRT4AKP_00023 [Klebsiella pneumoniae]
MRVRESATVELLTKQLPQVDVLSNSISSGVTDSADAQGNISFSSNTQDRMSSIQVPLLEPASLVQLPKGQAFALLAVVSSGSYASHYRTQHTIR